MAYTWVKTHQDIVNFLRDKRNQQKMLITMLKNAGVDGGFMDKDESGQPIPLTEIDPFTFFRSIYKYGNDRCLQILKKIALEKAIVHGEYFKMRMQTCGIMTLKVENNVKIWQETIAKSIFESELFQPKVL